MLWIGEPKLDKDGQPTGKTEKAPRSPHGRNIRASKTNPENHAPFEVTLDKVGRLLMSKEHAGKVGGIGFALLGSDPYAVIDLDDAIDDDGALTPIAARVLDLFPGCYTEVSQSGRGLHIVIEGKLPGRNRNKKPIEIYGHNEFIAMTGAVYGGRVEVRPMQGALDELLSWPELAEAKAKVKTVNTEKNLASPQAASLIGDDAVLVERALSSKQGAKFQSLWFGEWVGLLNSKGKPYPSQSEADIALCGMFEFWTCGDGARMKRLFQQSGLYRPDEPHKVDYAVEEALANSTGHYSGRGERKAAKAAVVNTEGCVRKEEGAAPIKLERVIDRDTHDANAERLVVHHAHELRYVPGLGWLNFNGRYWEANEGAAKLLAAGVARHVQGEIDEHALAMGRAESGSKAHGYHTAMVKKLMKWRRSCGMYENKMGTLGSADALLQFDAGALDTHTHLLNVQNGTLDLSKPVGEQLRPHSAGDFLTQIAAVRYEPGAECPRWRAFIEEVLPDAEVRRFIHKWLGYTLTGEIGEQCMAFTHGGGSNGKNTLFETFMAMLGDGYTREAAPNLLMAMKGERHTTDRAMLRGARMVLSSESEQGQQFASQIVKNLIGQTQMTARLMRQDNITFPIRFKLCLMSNDLPEVKDLTDGFWRRLRLVPFTQQFPVNDEVPKALLRELPGILNWCLEGHAIWKAEELGEPVAMVEAKREYREESNEVGQFVAECTTPAKGNKVASNRVYTHYRDWCRAEGLKPLENNGPFKGAMKKNGVEWGRPKGFRCYKDVELRVLGSE
jgi:putative DNA primase/helicase